MRKISLAWKLSKNFAFKEKKHFVIPVFAIGIGFAGLMVVLAVIHGFDALLLDSLTGFFPHLLVDSDIKPVEDTNEFIAVFRIGMSEGVLSNGRDFKGVIIYDTDQVGLNFFSKFIVSGRYPEAGEVLLGSRLSENMNLEPGEKVNITRVVDGKPVSTEKTISGILRTGIYQFDSTICITRSRDGSFWAVYLDDPRNAEKVRIKLEKELTGDIYTWTELNGSFAKAVKIDEFFALIITFFVVLLSGFGIMNATLYSVLTRKHEIGILSSMGLSPGYIAFVFWLQAIVVSFIGLLIGAALGGVSLLIISNIRIPLPQDVFYATYLPVQLKLTDIFFAIVFEFFLVTMFSLMPTRYIGKIDPTEVLKYE
ncbi:ABC transporter permease [Kosmotoga pacifica]|uniref:ABC3 transporter permease C-terminal domain-containing protein n=1 Tax=Kosmotoga pacifica TaxID=1330330 RepID=A0A0G2ZBM1_9BACT|nr:FtsX-like permease family protein [Kosmotoga pacifica]AKI96944.1 hypothetical protein IX53_02915 [Kosmotoga pacifica]